MTAPVTFDKDIPATWTDGCKLAEFDGYMSDSKAVDAAIAFLGWRLDTTSFFLMVRSAAKPPHGHTLLDDLYLVEFNLLRLEHTIRSVGGGATLSSLAPPYFILSNLHTADWRLKVGDMGMYNSTNS